MSPQEKICGFRFEWCLYVVSILTVVSCYEPCPAHIRHSVGSKVPNIDEHIIDWAFTHAEQLVQGQRYKSGRVYPKRVKTAETVHPQASEKPQIPRMEAKQRVFEEVSNILTSSYDLSPTRVTCGLPYIHPIVDAGTRALEACTSSNDEIVCNSTDKYRTADGSCNNLKNPTWGRAFSPFNRLLLPTRKNIYGTGPQPTCEPPLPTPRFLSSVVHSMPGKRSSKVNTLYVFFGQFIVHDITFTAQSTSANNEAIQCCPPRNDNHPQCAPIDASPPIYPNKTCINFVRSAIYPTCTLGHRTQINTVSSFLDASQIYGNSEAEMRSLRALDGTGKLLVQDSQFGPLLPKSTNPDNDRCSLPQENQICFRAGDSRVNQTPMLTSMHTIWVREHNRIATALKSVNPHWKEERLFQEARKITIAEYQAIIIKEYLPLTLGDERMNALLSFTNALMYAEIMDPSMYTEVSTAALRFGHSMIDGTLAEIPRRPRHSGHLLRDKFSEPFGLYEGEVDLLMMGAGRTPAQGVDPSLVRDVTEYMYRTRGQPSGLDLAAMNIQRGRDHALPSYVDCYNLCDPVHKIESFYDLEEQHLMTTETMWNLRHAYRNVKDIDLWTGIISEIPTHGAVLGPTGACLIEAQFYNLISGDRYWYTHKNQTGSFTEYQMNYFEWYPTLSNIICGNTNITEIPYQALELPSVNNYLRQCRDIYHPYLWAWMEH